MQRASNLVRRLATVSVLMISAGSGGAICAAAADEASPQLCLVIITDEVATELAALEFAVPVVLGYGNDPEPAWHVGLLGRNQEHIDDLLEKLVYPAEPGPGCVHEGAVACCDDATGTFKVSSVYKGERVWVETGERCALVPIDPHDDYVGSGAKEVPVPSALSQALLEECGIDAKYSINLASRSGALRLLVETTSQSGELSLPPRVMQRSGLRWRSPLIHARHHPIPTNCPTTDTPNPACCKDDGGDRRCKSTDRHWWVHKPSSNWCRREGCDCNNCPD